MEAINLYDKVMQDPLIPDDMRILAWYEKVLSHEEAKEKNALSTGTFINSCC